MARETTIAVLLMFYHPLRKEFCTSNQIVVKFDEKSFAGSPAAAAETIVSNLQGELKDIGIDTSINDTSRSSVVLDMNFSNPSSTASTVSGQIGIDKLNETQQATVAGVQILPNKHLKILHLFRQ